MYVDSTWSDHHARRQVELEAAASRSRLAAALRADQAQPGRPATPVLRRLAARFTARLVPHARATA